MEHKHGKCRHTSWRTVPVYIKELIFWFVDCAFLIFPHLLVIFHHSHLSSESGASDRKGQGEVNLFKNFFQLIRKWLSCVQCASWALWCSSPYSQVWISPITIWVLIDLLWEEWMSLCHLGKFLWESGNTVIPCVGGAWIGKDNKQDKHKQVLRYLDHIAQGPVLRSCYLPYT